MGLLDSLVGAALGGGQQQQPQYQQNPIAGILMQLLASQGGGQAVGGAQNFGATGGGLGGLLGSLMGGSQSQPGMGQAAGGGVLAAGLAALVQQFSGAGYGQQAQSWVGRGQNQPIDPNALVQVFGRDRLQALAQQHGMPMDAMLTGLSDQLPMAVDELTPEGQVPDADGMQRVFQKVAGRDGGMKS